MKVFTVGVFDILHIGHVNLFKNARTLGQHLTVAVQESDIVKKYKPESRLIYSTEERMYLVRSVRFVDEVVSYRDVSEIIKNVDFDIFVIGPDQNHSGFKSAISWCEEHNKKVVVLPRTEGISSSWLKEQIKIM